MFGITTEGIASRVRIDLLLLKGGLSGLRLEQAYLGIVQEISRKGKQTAAKDELKKVQRIAKESVSGTTVLKN